MPTYRVTVPVHTAVVYEVEAECLAAVYGEIDAGHGVLIQAATVEPGDFDDDESHWQIEIVPEKGEKTMPVLTAACELSNYDPVTDVREQGRWLGADTVAWLQSFVGQPVCRLEPGLRGWPPYNATLFLGSAAYPVAITNPEGGE